MLMERAPTENNRVRRINKEKISNKIRRGKKEKKERGEHETHLNNTRPERYRHLKLHNFLKTRRRKYDFKMICSRNFGKL